ncbi:MAG: acyltransferase family protein [Eubacteriales bacterium]
MSIEKKRIHGFDYMRGLACLLVVLYHYTTRIVELFPELSERWTFKIPFGYMGVCVFFLLSGYLSLRHYKEDTTVWTYVKSKLVRLFPCYWCAVILTFVVTKFFLVERAVSLKSFLINLTMLESFLGVEPVDGAYWTLANELIFYFFMAFFMVFLKQKTKFSFIAIIWLLIANIIPFFEGYGIVYSLANKLFMAQYAHMFLAGGFVFFLFNSKKAFEYVVNTVGWLLCIATQFRMFNLDYGFFFLLSNVLLVGIILMEKSNVEPPSMMRKVLYPLTFIASISYPLYLIHQNIGYVMIVNLYRAGLKSEWIILLPIIVLITLGYLMHKFIENPICKKKQEKTP